MSHLLPAQNASDAVVPITVTTDNATPAIHLTWTLPAGLTNVMLRKKALQDNTWTSVAGGGPSATFYNDTDISIGTAYEYHVKQTVNGIDRNGYVYAGIDLPPVTASRGKLIFVVDTALIEPLEQELLQWERDLLGDGWQVIRYVSDPASETVTSLKAAIKAIYLEDSAQVKAAFLLGNLPVPYSGNICPDGHPDHCGAWPTDYYYADMDDNSWTDMFINTVVASRPANHNIPGDGKFDQSNFPTTPEIVVGRVDFGNLQDWEVSQTELYRRYFQKNHAFRTGQYVAEQKTLVDDNFGFFSGEAFARNGWQNGYALTGTATVEAADFFENTDTTNYLIGYGCGGGWYQGAGGVGSSDNFKTDSVNIVFSMIFGSYHGDWDYENNPFLFSALASKGSILTTTWAGRPNWYFHHTGLGEPMSTSIRRTWQNAFSSLYPGNYGNGQVHESFLGDPTLRLHVLPPVTSVSVAQECGIGTYLSWPASTTATVGYMVYRSNGDQMDYQPLSPEPIGNNFYLDTFDFGTGYTQAYHYMVKAVALQTTPTGSYYNQSVGVITNDGIQAPPLAADIVTTPYYNCAGYDGTIVVNTTGGNPPYCITYDPPVNPDYVPEGIYTVTIVDENGNAFVDTAIVGSVGQTTVLTIYSTGPACLGYTTTYYNSSQEVHNSWDITGGHIVYDGDNTINVVWDVLGPGLVSFYGYTSLGGCGSVGELEVIVDSCIVATSQPDVEVVRFYPNPATDILTIDFPDGMAGSVSAYLTDIHGRKVLEQLLVAEKTEIPIAHLPPGVYEVVVTKKNIMYIEKLVKL
jgi:hypothetical protein